MSGLQIKPVSSLLDDNRYRQAVHLFNAREWYAAHDAFEELWHEAAGDDRFFLQGIIQIAVAEYHLGNGNHRGSLLLMAEALHHLEAPPEHHLGLDLQSLKAIVTLRLAGLQAGQTLVAMPLPVLASVKPGKV